MTTPNVTVGITRAQYIRFTLHGNFLFENTVIQGENEICCTGDSLLWNGYILPELIFTPQNDFSSFSIQDVTIGIEFHWERKETQCFNGTLKFIVENGQVRVLNILPVESYLTSVISSEMKATSPVEFLKAHAVISRSWLLAQMKKRQHRQNQPYKPTTHAVCNEQEYIRWYDREDHTLFDVCADDHCQRYQGITRATDPAIAQAIKETRGQVLMSGESICDARFSKCCGGVSEQFSTCWENTDYPYLMPVRDAEEELLPDLTHEENANRWIRSTPNAFCHTDDNRILESILNYYDRETADFYRWKAHYQQEELATLLHERSGIDFGHVVDLVPVKRGPSGRIMLLKIIGTLRSLIIGKELEIRRVLSTSHLLSSAFVVDKGRTVNGIPETFTLTGAGWGHGVGLCQIGAAVMGEQGYTYREILLHYYRGASIETLY